ncbi:glycosyltransferase [Brachyspira hyodysenteriae]|uniref:glycosyltransferase n=1 Tax=Brachyspira hyodysenteriae TaxID=159 RepID=UPI00063D9A4D|nr:glycosyltransferase [Brachyspira hyodysenteriae]KLI17100.1 hypothetical protein SU44_04495 [Brachyspira hyodysenteriae]MDA0023185.1 glycosyltransferase [Brachyspira hyodysenteriae]QTM05499.1 glycosyltransferase [Brachyspira hyodysenteriae]
MSYHCECEQCKNKEFNPEDYIIKEEDFKILDEERPLGISGHLRVKDEAMSLAECIDSCINALDELIITYNKSTDNTEEILKEYKNKYPDKIRIYYYAPNLIKYDKDEYITKYSELHYLYNYYNFGYVKIKYRYYMKIDADQVYFTKKLLDIREALLIDINDKRNIDTKILSFLKIDKIAWYIPIKKLRNTFRSYFIKKIFNKDIIPEMFAYEYLFSFKELIIYNRIKSVDDFSLELGGFNTIINNDELLLYTDDFIFNGCVGDHNIWKPDSNYKYQLYTANGLEIINKLRPTVIIGFCWIHFGFIKRRITLNSKLHIDVLNIKNTTWKDMKDIILSVNNNKYNSEFAKNTYLIFGDKYFDIDKKYVTKEFYNRYLKKPLEYAIKNQDKLW